MSLYSCSTAPQKHFLLFGSKLFTILCKVLAIKKGDVK